MKKDDVAAGILTHLALTISEKSQLYYCKLSPMFWGKLNKILVNLKKFAWLVEE